MERGEGEISLNGKERMLIKRQKCGEMEGEWETKEEWRWRQERVLMKGGRSI